MESSMRRAILFSLLAAAAACCAEPDGLSLEPGNLPMAWRPSGPQCTAVPDWQVHEYNPDFYILRESGCINYEKPFLYLIFGQDKVLLEDTGAGPVKTAAMVEELIAKWAQRKSRTAPQLVVIHSHGHGDHIAGDKDLQALPGVQFIAATPAALQSAAGIAKWPDEAGHIDLGGRVLDIVPIPGHNDASIAIYDRRTGILLTGDSLYPGRLYVADFPAFAASAARLEAFVLSRPVAHVLGTHIEQMKTPYRDYKTGTVYQPAEHDLELARAHVLELAAAFRSLNGKPGTVALSEFTVMPRNPPASPGPEKD
jgi:glyoxylase-like metal-dependent hydrolase (beta-lactamase superfamily II)